MKDFVAPCESTNETEVIRRSASWNEIQRSENLRIYFATRGNACCVNQVKNVTDVTDPVNQKLGDRKWLLVDDAHPWSVVESLVEGNERDKNRQIERERDVDAAVLPFGKKVQTYRKREENLFVEGRKESWCA